MTNSIQKGKAGEREFRDVCNAEGYATRRGQQFCGSNGDADVVGLPNMHIEVKRVEKLNVRKALKQAIADAKDGAIPMLAHRVNGDKQWMVTLRSEDFFKIYRESEYGNETISGLDL